MNDKCSICDKEIIGMGHNPQPIKVNKEPLKVSDRCCDNCNTNLVVPARTNENLLNLANLMLSTGKRESEVFNG